MKSRWVLLIFAAMAPTVHLMAGAHDDLSGIVGFVSLTTVQEVKAAAPLDDFAPNVLVRFTRSGSTSEFLAMTGKDGTAFLPIEAGEYCVDAFGLDGRGVKLAPHSAIRSHRCFTAVAGKTVEFSVTLAADAKYGGDVPSLRIQ